MKRIVLILLMAACTAAASAQTQPKAAAPTAKPAAKPATTAAKLPFGVPAPGIPAVKTIKKTAFSLQYQEIKVGTGADAEPNKLYKVLYTGWRAKDGVKFDSSADHPGPPLKDKDGKPVLDADGKPKLGDPQPLAFPQGMGRLIPGFDQGFGGMKVGGKRRLFIPWQLAYGNRDMPDHGPDHPGIPPKSDLIFDVELVDVADLPAPPARPGMGGMPPGRPLPGGAVAPKPGTPGAPATGAPAPGTPAPGTPAPGTAPAAHAAPGTPAAPATLPKVAAPTSTPTPGAPAAPAAAPAPAAPAAPAQPQPK